MQVMEGGSGVATGAAVADGAVWGRDETGLREAASGQVRPRGGERGGRGEP